MEMRTLIFALTLLATGCGTVAKKDTPDPVQIQRVPQIITAECPTPKDVTRPALLINLLSDEDKNDAGKIAQAYKATILQLQRYSSELETMLDAYRKPVTVDTK